jgi:poly(ribitol-phosphate) beta-N-acetylglucosaminyltransferase
VGVNGRHVNQAIFASSEVDIDLFDSALPWSLSNTKLFRRELIERHRLRYREDMPVGSDQPFTLEACFRARRISVLADYEFYYLVRRLNSANLTYRSIHDERLHSVETIMNFAAELIQPGKQRDIILLRHFSVEVAKLLEDDFLLLDCAVQERVRAGVSRLVEQYLTDNIREQLGVETRLRLSIAHDGNLSGLLAVIRQDAEHGVPPTVVDGDRWYAGYPGFRDARLSVPDNWFDVTDAAAEWIAKLDAMSVSWQSLDAGGRALTITARSPLTELTALCSAPIRLSAGNVSGHTTAAYAPDGAGSTVRTQFSVDQLLAESAPTGERRAIRTLVSAFGTTGAASLRAPRLPQVLPLICRRGVRLYAIAPTKDHSGQLMIAIAPVTTRKVIERMRRWWLQRARQKT